MNAKLAHYLKGQSHKKFGKIRPWDVSLGPNQVYILLTITGSHLD
jgi:hypothetical protein